MNAYFEAVPDTIGLLWRAATGPALVYALLAPALLAAGVGIMLRFKARGPAWLDWSPLGSRANLALRPIGGRWWLPWALALGALMPMLALIEEAVFRFGTTSLLRAVIWGGVAFGVIHLTSLVSVRMVLYLTVIGWLLAGAYAIGGQAACFTLHAVYNLSALALAVATRKKGLI